MKRWFWNVMLAIDQLVNTIGGGYPDESISSRFGKHKLKKFVQGQPLGRLGGAFDKLLDWGDPRSGSHALNAIEYNEGLATKLPDGFRLVFDRGGRVIGIRAR